MFLPYINGKLRTSDGAEIQYIERGQGIPIILIPGAGDGLRTVGQFPYSYIVSRMYRNWAKEHRFILMGRREPIPEGFTIADFAEDYIWAMDQLKVAKAHIETNSAGGPIGQQIAVFHPDRVLSLVLGQTFAYMDEKFRALIEQWLNYVRNKRWREFHVDTVEKTFAPEYLKKYRKYYPLLKFMKNPSDTTRIERVFESILFVDNRDILPQIQCPTLIIGGDMDVVTRPELQQMMADLIPNSERVIVTGTGHGQNQEKPQEHEKHVLDFYRKVERNDP